MSKPYTKYVEYHSAEWDVLVESGWYTWIVDDNGIAYMRRKPEPYYRWC